MLFRSRRIVVRETPKCVPLAEKGMHTSWECASLMAALVADLAVGRITPQAGNAMCNATGKMLKAVEMQQKYGVDGDGQQKELRLTRD